MSRRESLGYTQPILKHDTSMRSSALAIVLALLGSSVSAADYMVVVPIPTKSSKPALSVTLHEAELPDGRVGKAYLFDFKGSLQIKGDPDSSVQQATWRAESLPTGLSIDSTGVLTGAPSEMAPAGANFRVVARYKNQEGRQTYTIRVGYEALDVVKISAGYNHTCAVTTTGAVKCWGDNSIGQLGNGTTVASPTPVQVQGLTGGVTDVAVNGSHSCAVQGTMAYCWGNNSSGQLGNGNQTNSKVPVRAVNAASAFKLALGAYHSCAITTSGGVECFGYGAGNFGLTSGVSDIASANYHTCVVQNGAARCWGPNESGQLGAGHMNGTWDVITPVGLESGVASVAVGYSHSCATKTDGSTWCWGANDFGQLGKAGIASAVPVQVPGLSGATRVVANNRYACAQSATGVYCWGASLRSMSAQQATRVPELGGGAQLTAGGTLICAAEGGSAKCIGENSQGQLGDGTYEYKDLPTTVRK